MYIHAADLSLYHIPEVFYWIQHRWLIIMEAVEADFLDNIVTKLIIILLYKLFELESCVHKESHSRLLDICNVQIVLKALNVPKNKNLPIITWAAAWIIDSRQVGSVDSCCWHQIMTLPFACHDSSDQVAFFQHATVQWVCNLSYLLLADWRERRIKKKSLPSPVKPVCLNVCCTFWVAFLLTSDVKLLFKLPWSSCQLEQVWPFSSQTRHIHTYSSPASQWMHHVVSALKMVVHKNLLKVFFEILKLACRASRIWSQQHDYYF